MKRIFAHIGFSVAVALLAISLLETKIIICITIGLAILFVASLCLSYFRRNVSFPLCFGSALLACVMFLCAFNLVATPQIELDNTDCKISFYSIDLEDRDSNGAYVYIAKTTSISVPNAPQNIKLRVKSNSPLNVEPYEVVEARATLYSLADNPYSSFGYWADNIFLTAKVTNVVETGVVKKSPMISILRGRVRVIQAFKLMLSPDEAGVAIALLTGNKAYIQPKALNMFRYSGATHIMAVSGLHLTVVAGAIYLLLRKFRTPNIINALVTNTVMLSYISLAGFSKSAVRAGVMMLIMTIAPLFKSRADSLNSLGVALFVICLNPFAVTDCSVLLSVVAVLALIVTASSDFVRHNAVSNMDSPPVKRVQAFVDSKATGVIASLAVLLMTAPIMYMCYGSMSISSLVSNFIAVPFGSLAMILSVVAFCFFGIGANAITAVVARVLQITVDVLLWLVEELSSFSGSLVHLGEYASLIIVGAMIIIAICFIFNNSVLLKRGLALAIVFVVIASGAIAYLTSDNSTMLVTQNGAVVINHNDKTIVSNVKNTSDYYDIYTYLSSNNMNIDLLVDNGDSDIASRLTNVVYTNTVLTHQLNQCMLDSGCYKSIELKDKCHMNFGDGFVLDFDSGEYITNVGDISVALSMGNLMNTDVVVYNDNNVAVDHNGVVELSDGNVLYTFTNDGFSVRRINQWLE